MSALRRGAGLWLVLFAAYAATIGLDATPGSRFTDREAHVLLSAASVASDRSLDLRDEYADRAWEGFYAGELEPTAGLTNGRLLEPQGIGFPLLIAPAYAIGGATGVELFLAALMALAFCLAAALARRLVPDPWPTGAALAAGLSAPALGAATTVSPDVAGAVLLSLGAIFALRVRERVRVSSAFWCALCAALAPWMAVALVVPAAVVAFALARWLRRRNRGMTGFVAVEVVATSAVVFITVHDRLFGGLTPDAARLRGEPGFTGASGVREHLERAPRLVGLWLDRGIGLVRWAPLAALAFVAVWLLWRSRRDRVAVAVPERVDVEVTALFLMLLCGAVIVVAAFLTPATAGPWFPGHALVPALPAGAALAAWGLQHTPRVGAVLAALTVVAGGWVLIAGRVADGVALQPPRGPLPWGGAEGVLPRFGNGSAGEDVLIGAVVVALVAVVAREVLALRTQPGSRPVLLP
jgi:hypothetical protein